MKTRIIILLFLVYLASFKALAKINNYNANNYNTKVKQQSSKVPNITFSYIEYLNLIRLSNYSHFLPNYLPNREQIYLDNVKKINEHNQLYNDGKVKFFLGLNQFTDWLDEEFNEYFISNLKPPVENPINPLPIFVDYRRQGFLGNVKNQNKIRGSTLFAIIAAIEAQYFKMTNELISLSEQFINDCSDIKADLDVSKSIDQVYEFLKSYDGLPSNDVYPLGSQKKDCKSIERTEKFKITETKKLDSKKESDILEAVAHIGPLVALLSVPTEFKNFTGGLITDSKFCSGPPNHAVTLVGYNKQVFIFRNSWGEDWGESGYFRISRKSCSFSEAPIYALIDISNESQNY